MMCPPRNLIFNLNLMSIYMRFDYEERDLWPYEREWKKQLQKLSNWLVVNLKTDI